MDPAESQTEALVCSSVGGSYVKTPVIFEALRPDEVLVDIRKSAFT